MKKVFLMILILGACQSQQNKKPSNLMSEEQMVAFLIDSHMTEGQLQALKVSRDSTDVLFKPMEKELYVKHGIDSSQFMTSYHYYLQNIEQMADIYDAVIDSLSLREKVLINKGQ